MTLRSLTRRIKFRSRNWGESVARSLAGSETANYPRLLATEGPNPETMAFIKTIKAKCIAEVGIYKGETSLAFAHYLAGHGQLHLYDYYDRIADVKGKLNAFGYTNVEGFGCSYKYLDSYNWALARQIERNPSPIYDYVMLDGAHTWAIDALAFLLVDKLLKVGGYIDFDDYNWVLGQSPSMKPSAFPLTAKLYSAEQIASKQVKMIVDILVRRDGRYKEIRANKIFRKEQ